MADETAENDGAGHYAYNEIIAETAIRFPQCKTPTTGGWRFSLESKEIFWWPIAESNHGHADFQTEPAASRTIPTSQAHKYITGKTGVNFSILGSIYNKRSGPRVAANFLGKTLTRGAGTGNNLQSFFDARTGHHPAKKPQKIRYPGKLLDISY